MVSAAVSGVQVHLSWVVGPSGIKAIKLVSVVYCKLQMVHDKNSQRYKKSPFSYADGPTAANTGCTEI